MCGIAGILEKFGSNPQELNSRLQSLAASLRHRGPDASGTWNDAFGLVGLAHTRLAILDLTSSGNQPMSTPDGALHIVFNGEIYNFQALRADLEAGGVHFISHSDTEVILRLYERDGSAMLGRLRGMFALAIWDSRTRRCLLARDPLGVKPIYYSIKGSRLAFASELQALQKQGLTGSDLDAGAILDYFKTGSVPEPQTLLQDCHCLEAGHYLIWQEGRIAKHCFFSHSHEYDETPPETAIRTAREALLESVESHFISDVPVGLFLSGGIDSTAILALATILGKRNLDTFCVSVDDPTLNEGETAQRTAFHFGTRHHNILIDADRAYDSFARFLHVMDQPSIDGFNTYLVSAAAREQGVKVVLSGLGGDEIFGGYRSFEVVPKIMRAGRIGGYLPLINSALGYLLERISRDNRARRMGSFLQIDPSPANAHTCFRGIFSTHDARLLAAHYLRCSPKDVPEVSSMQISAADDREAVADCELRLYMRNQLLKDSDVMSMAHGLELRVPFVDSNLLQRIGSIPPELRLRSGKQLLLEAVPEIPDWVKKRSKQGFAFPFEKWLSQRWDGPFAEVSRRLPNKNVTWYQKWCLFMLDNWLQTHNVRRYY
jgi:asparagine synthase (glutamine-hydrolysing)